MKPALLSVKNATIIAAVLHGIGAAGIMFFDRDLFIRATPINLLISCALLMLTQPAPRRGFFIFFILCFFVGFGAEYAGVKGVLFGDYEYGSVLGAKLWGVPPVIGLNWFIIIFCCGTAVGLLFEKLSARLQSMQGGEVRTIKTLGTLSLITDGAMLAVFFDWVMEPVAVAMSFWQWRGEIPLYNYVCWLVISALLLTAFALLRFHKRNVFAVNLLLIMLSFFLLIRSTL